VIKKTKIKGKTKIKVRVLAVVEVEVVHLGLIVLHHLQVQEIQNLQRLKANLAKKK
jgi:hypothetical protein